MYASLNANAKMNLKERDLPIQEATNMEIQRNKVCGADIHKKFLVATVLSRDGNKITTRFGMSLDDLLNFKNWVIENKCEQVAIESTGVYWVPIYTVLEGSIPVIVANAHKIKHIPGRKTDVRDSEWIAELCLNGLIEPSRIFPREDRELRTLTRAREALIKNKTQMKNRIHQTLESACIKLSSVLTDIFGKSGRHILNGLIYGKSVNEILRGIPSKRIRNKEILLKEAIKNNLDATQVIIIRDCLELMEIIQTKIDNLDKEILIRIQKHKDDLEIALSFPGMGINSAPSILAEIGDYRDFDTPEKLAAWCGLVPSVYQSADKLMAGGITKQGSKHIRSMLIEVAYAASRTRNSRLRKFFLRIQAKKGTKKATVALARKVLCILHHLLMNGEKYQEDDVNKTNSNKSDQTHQPIKISFDEMISVLTRAGYEVSLTPMRKGEFMNGS